MPRTHGYSPKGERAYGTHAWNEKGRINVIGAITNQVFLTLCLFSQNINADTFFAWVTQDLLPKIQPNSVIVMDNASFHKRTDITDAIKQKKCILEWLPTYSPDLNPIEKKWAEVKAKRRKQKCTTEELFEKHTSYVNL